MKSYSQTFSNEKCVLPKVPTVTEGSSLTKKGVLSNRPAVSRILLLAHPVDNFCSSLNNHPHIRCCGHEKRIGRNGKNFWARLVGEEKFFRRSENPKKCVFGPKQGYFGRFPGGRRVGAKFVAQKNFCSYRRQMRRAGGRGFLGLSKELDTPRHFSKKFFRTAGRPVFAVFAGSALTGAKGGFWGVFEEKVKNFRGKKFLWRGNFA